MFRHLCQAVRSCIKGVGALVSARPSIGTQPYVITNAALDTVTQATPLVEWKVVYESVPGTSHFTSGVPCQDSACALDFTAGDETVLVAACSDGAGTAQFSDCGSSLAARGIVDQVRYAVENGLRVCEIDQERMREWYRAVRTRLNEEATSRNTEIRQLACTLLIAIVANSRAVFAQLGDGAIVIRDSGGFAPIFWPQSGEYANTTNFLSDHAFETHVAFEARDGRFDDLALFTDGIQMLALSYASRTAHAPFFSPLFESLANAADPVALKLPLQQFLGSDKVNGRTDDDKTLILACRTRRHDLESPL